MARKAAVSRAPKKPEPKSEENRHQELKAWPETFEAIMQGLRSMVRRNDRDYRVDDILHVKEWDWKRKDPIKLGKGQIGDYTGRELGPFTVTHIVNNGTRVGSEALPGSGLRHGFVVIQFEGALNG